MTGDPSYPRPAAEPTAGPAPAAPGPIGPDPTAPSPPAPASETAGPGPDPAGLPAQHTLDRTRTGGLWVAAIAAVVVLLMLLIFILQNGEQVQVNLFGANPDLPLGVALLLAAVLGALVVGLLGTARVVQLRITAKRHRVTDRTARS